MSSLLTGWTTRIGVLIPTRLIPTQRHGSNLTAYLKHALLDWWFRAPHHNHQQSLKQHQINGLSCESDSQLELISLFISDRFSEETDQSSTQAGKHGWKILNNGMTHRRHETSVLMTRKWRRAFTVVFLPHSCFQVTAEELSGNDDYVELSFSARKLDDKVCACSSCAWNFPLSCNCVCGEGVMLIQRTYSTKVQSGIRRALLRSDLRAAPTSITHLLSLHTQITILILA